MLLSVALGQNWPLIGPATLHTIPFGKLLQWFSCSQAGCCAPMFLGHSGLLFGMEHADEPTTSPCNSHFSSFANLHPETELNVRNINGKQLNAVDLFFDRKPVVSTAEHHNLSLIHI